MANQTWKFLIVESRRRRRSLATGAGEVDDDRNQCLESEDEREENIGTMPNRREKEKEPTGDEGSVDVIAGEVEGEEENFAGEGEQQELKPYPKMEVFCGEEEKKNMEVDVDIDGDDEELPLVSLISFPGSNAPFSSASQSGIFYTAVASRGTHLNNAEDAASHGGSLRPPREMATSTEPNTFLLSTEDAPLAAVDNVADGQMSPTVKIASGSDEFGVFIVAGVQVIKLKMVDASTIQQDMPKMGTEAEVGLNNGVTNGDGEVAGGSNCTGGSWEQRQKTELDRCGNFINNKKRASGSIPDDSRENRGNTAITSSAPGSAKAQLAVVSECDTDFGSEDGHMMMEFGGGDADNRDDDEKPSIRFHDFDGWASKEVMDFVEFMGEDVKKPHSRFAVTELLWSYSESQNLRKPTKTTDIVCDDRLRTIFGRKIVGRFELIQLLEPHFASNKRRRAGPQLRDEQVRVEEEAADADGSAAHKRFSNIIRAKRKADGETLERPCVEEFAAITRNNIDLIYLRRKLLEGLLDDPEFDSKVCNTFVRIRVPGEINKSEVCYRLVQVVGTRSQAEHYKLARKVTNLVLEVVNLHKREDVTIDTVSNHDFNEEECQRLRQSIKCGFIKALTVGDIQDKAISLRELKVNDWVGLAAETKRLVNLRDCASEKGLKTELRKCVKNLQKLDSPAYLAKMVLPEVISDPRMHPDYNSDGNDDETKDGMSNILDKSLLSTGDKILPVGRLKGSQYNRDLEGTNSKQSTWRDPNHSQEGDRVYILSLDWKELSHGEPAHRHNGVESAEGRGDEERERGRGRIEQQNDVTGVDTKWIGNGRNGPTPDQKLNAKVDLSLNSEPRSGRSDYSGIAGMTPVIATEADSQTMRGPAPPSAPSLPKRFPLPSPNISTQGAFEAGEEEIWHYIDPFGIVQGPISMWKLRRWTNEAEYFPKDLRIWKTTQPREESILLTDALVGRFQNARESFGSAAGVGNPVVPSITEEIAQNFDTTRSTLPFTSTPTIESTDGWRENGGASSWTDPGESDDAGRSASHGSLVVNPGYRNFEASLARPLERYLSTSHQPAVAPHVGPHHHPKVKQAHQATAMIPSCNYCGKAHKATECNVPAEELFCDYCEKKGHWEQVCFAKHPERTLMKLQFARLANRKEIFCRYYAKGYCMRGDSCDYRHD